MEPFVGRAALVDRLRIHAVDAAAGRGGLVLVSGEPGIGKTHLAEELAYLAEREGLRVLWCNCCRDDGAPQLWPWLQVLRAHDSTLDPAGDTAADGPPPFQVVDAITTLLCRSADTAPVLVIVEDLHRADDGSLLLLRHLAPMLHRVPLLVLGTYRAAEIDCRGRSLLAGMTCAREHIALPGLTPNELTELLLALGVARERDLAVSLHRRTGGNPLFVRELAGSSGGLLPERVAQIVQDRLSRLTEPCRALLETAAVVGDPFRLDVLRTVSADDAGSIGSLIDEALAAGLVEALVESAGHFRFTPAVVAEVLSLGLGTSRREALQWQKTTAGEGLHDSDRPKLSAREQEVASLVADGLTNGRIAERLFISKRTVEAHVDHIRRKLDVESRAGIVSVVLRLRMHVA